MSVLTHDATANGAEDAVELFSAIRQVYATQEASPWLIRSCIDDRRIAARGGKAKCALGRQPYALEMFCSREDLDIGRVDGNHLCAAVDIEQIFSLEKMQVGLTVVAIEPLAKLTLQG